MDLHGGGERRAKLCSTGVREEDRLSSLPDDLLRRILRGLPSTADAAQTSLLSSRWARLWAGIPEIWFGGPAVPGRVHAALAAYAAHAGAPIHGIHVTTPAAPTDSTAVWLRLAAAHLSGELSVLITDAPLDDVVGTIELPCFANATKITLRLAYLGLALPDSGVFAKLETLFLEGFILRDDLCELGDAFSSTRCPSLRRLIVRDVLDVHKLAISSQSLVSVSLGRLQDLQQLVLVAPMLERLYFSPYLREEKLSTVNISAPRLEKLTWAGRFEPSFFQRAHLQELGTIFKVYIRHSSLNLHYSRLFRHFEADSLHLRMSYPAKSVNSYEYLMDGITFLPDVKNLRLSILSGAHAFGASTFHLLRLCAGIRRLKLKLISWKEPPECPLGCICDQQNGWKSENIFLTLLGEAEICGIKGVEHELVFLKQLFRWATALKKMTITFDPLVAVSDSLCEEIASFSRSETCVEIYQYRNGRKVLFAPVV